FWCTEAVFTMLKGIVSVEPGYSGGIEVIKIVYEPDKLSFEELLQVFFETHDPTTPNRQGNDVGPQYHSVVFYTTERQKEKTEHYIKMIAGRFTKPIVTTVAPRKNFYKAEDYHQKYYETHKDAPYCQPIIDPKVEKVQTKFKNLLK
ncbi:MAG: peptide-methionine (S)-S-oxide reductase, partial [Patescibacteria group bacterium]|nr:peptide-methionine (S)-S-oxide reductase [Patescibacteria group bacterium]